MKPNTWTHLLFESFCVRKCAYALKRDKYWYAWEGTDKPLKKELNPYYVPGTKTPRKPKGCPGEVGVKCHEIGCPFLMLWPVKEGEA